MVGSVPTELLDSFDVRLKESLKRIVANGINMKRMSMVVDRDERQVRPHSVFQTFLAHITRRTVQE